MCIASRYVHRNKQRSMQPYTCPRLYVNYMQPLKKILRSAPHPLDKFLDTRLAIQSSFQYKNDSVVNLFLYKRFIDKLSQVVSHIEVRNFWCYNHSLGKYQISTNVSALIYRATQRLSS